MLKREKSPRSPQYEDKRVLRPVSFNRETEAELLQASYEIENFSAWVKDQLAQFKQLERK